MRTCVLGAGSWGTTLAIVLAENGHEVSLWDHDAERAAVVARLRETPAFLPGVHISDGVAVTGHQGPGTLTDELIRSAAVNGSQLRSRHCSIALPAARAATRTISMQSSMISS